MDPSEFETLGYIALKKRMKEFVAADADLLKVVEEEMQPGKSAGGKPALIRLYNEKIATAMGVALIDGTALEGVGFVNPDTVGLPKEGDSSKGDLKIGRGASGTSSTEDAEKVAAWQAKAAEKGAAGASASAPAAAPLPESVPGSALTPEEVDGLGYMALKKRIRDFGESNAALAALIEEELAPGKSAGGKPALLKLYNEKIAPLLTGAAEIDGRDLKNVGFINPDAVGLPKME